MRRIFSLLLLVAFVLPASATVDLGFFGVCEHVNDAGEGFFYRNRTYNMCNRAGITWLRVDFPWADIEPTQGNWQWGKFDAILDDAEAHGIQILPILDYGSAYGGHDKLVSDDLDGWLAYVRNVLTRYADRLPAVEVWNEENIMSGNWVFWSGTTAQYVTMLRATYDAVKAIDPSVKVVIGGLAGDCEDYVSDLYSNGAKGCFDVMAIHPYVGTHGVEEEWKTGSLFNRRSHSYSLYIDRVRRKMDDNGDQAIPIWITEMGWSTETSGTTEANQAAFLAKAMEIAANKGIEKFFIYNLVAYEGDLANDQHCFGIIHHNYTAKPAFPAAQSKIRELAGAAADPYADYVWLTYGDYVDGQTVSWASAGYWSDGAAPSPDKDYLVDIGVFPDAKLLSAIINHDSVSFGGRSLILGRVGGRAGYFSHEGWGSTVTVSRLVLNNGVTVVGGQTGINGEWLAGNVTVASPSAAPFTIESLIGQYAWARDYTLSAALSGASGTALRGLCRATEPGGASLNLVVAGDCSAYAGGFIADGPFVTLRLGASALAGPSGAGAIALKSGATLAPLADGLTLSTRALVAEDGTGLIDVPAGQTFTISGPITGTFRKTGAGTLVLGNGIAGSGRIVAGEGSISVDEDTAPFVVFPPRMTLGTDSFEAYAVGTAAASLPGWTGVAAVAAGTPTTGDPPGVPLPEETHTRVLALDSGTAVRSYADSFTRNSQSVDLLLQVVRQTDENWQTVFADDGDLQLRLAFDAAGAPWLLHADDSGAPVWTRLGFSVAGGASLAAGVPSPAYESGAWVRVSIDLDYSTNPSGLAFAQVRLDGSCLLAAAGWRTPAAKGTGGSWFRLPAAASSTRRVSSIQFDGDGAIDDLVLASHDPALAPDFPSGAVTSAGSVPFSWFDSAGIPRDPAGDPDGDGLANATEYHAGTDPLDPASHPPAPTVLFLM